MVDETARKTSGHEAKAIFETMLMSDLHLEFNNVIIPEFSVVAPILILAGDIGSPNVPSLQTFLLAQCKRFEHIFYVAGNHSFYGGIYEDRLQQLQELDNLDPRIHFLQNKSYLLPNNVRILGTTLWSHVPRETAGKIGRCLNDYRLKIQKARENQEHVVIITHHAPSRRDTNSIDDEEAGVGDAFVNDHDADCVDPVRLWMYGHTHRSTDLTVNSTKVVSNQLGYTNENCGFRPNMKITLYDDGTVTVIDSVPSES
ncbi:unnamed protein product [Rotaria sp. Silwood1]|nr:unnamed protein product [Rotaria sp. Silwood1]